MQKYEQSNILPSVFLNIDLYNIVVHSVLVDAILVKSNLKKKQIVSNSLFNKNE